MGTGGATFDKKRDNHSSKTNWCPLFLSHGWCGYWFNDVDSGNLHRFSQAQEDGEVLEIFPCNPKDVRMLWTKMVIKERDDIAVLTQWLGGIPRV